MGLVTCEHPAPGSCPEGRGTAPAWRDLETRGMGTAGAAPKQPSETPSGRWRLPWRRSLLVPVVTSEGERSERMCWLGGWG